MLLCVYLPRYSIRYSPVMSDPEEISIEMKDTLRDSTNVEGSMNPSSSQGQELIFSDLEKL